MNLKILGVDPGSRITGIGVIEASDDRLSHLHHEALILTDGASFPERMGLLAMGFQRVLEHWKPNVIVLEKVFLGRNVESAFKLGHARGVLMAEAARRGVPTVEYAARQVKKGVTGRGAADKDEVQLVVRRLLGVGVIAPVDASDALALACHHAFEGRRVRILRQAMEMSK